MRKLWKWWKEAIPRNKNALPPPLPQPSSPNLKVRNLTSIPHICHLYHPHIGGKKIGHVEKFQIFHTTDVKKSEIMQNFEEFQISPHDRCEEIWNLPPFFCKICFAAIYPVFSRNLFVAIYALFLKKNWTKNCLGGEKIWDMLTKELVNNLPKLLLS